MEPEAERAPEWGLFGQTTDLVRDDDRGRMTALSNR